MEPNEEVKNKFKEQGLRLIGFFLDEETIGGVTYTEARNYTTDKVKKATTYVQEKSREFVKEHPDWKQEFEENANQLWVSLKNGLQGEKEHLKEKIVDYYYENREQKKESE